MKLKDWRSHMDAVRALGVELGQSGVLEILQKMRVVEPEEYSNIKGPIRYRLIERWTDVVKEETK